MKTVEKSFQRNPSNKFQRWFNKGGSGIGGSSTP